jgi:hypothetical protein
MDYIVFRIYFGGFGDTIHMFLIDDVISMGVNRLTNPHLDNNQLYGIEQSIVDETYLELVDYKNVKIEYAKVWLEFFQKTISHYYKLNTLDGLPENYIQFSSFGEMDGETYLNVKIEKDLSEKLIEEAEIFDIDGLTVETRYDIEIDDEHPEDVIQKFFDFLLEDFNDNRDFESDLASFMEEVIPDFESFESFYEWFSDMSDKFIDDHNMVLSTFFGKLKNDNFNVVHFDKFNQVDFFPELETSIGNVRGYSIYKIDVIPAHIIDTNGFYTIVTRGCAKDISIHITNALNIFGVEYFDIESQKHDIVKTVLFLMNGAKSVEMITFYEKLLAFVIHDKRDNRFETLGFLVAHRNIFEYEDKKYPFKIVRNDYTQYDQLRVFTLGGYSVSFDVYIDDNNVENFFIIDDQNDNQVVIHINGHEIDFIKYNGSLIEVWDSITEAGYNDPYKFAEYYI